MDALQRGGIERAPVFLLHHVERAEGIAHIPAHDLLAGCQKAACERAFQRQLIYLQQRTVIMIMARTDTTAQRLLPRSIDLPAQVGLLEVVLAVTQTERIAMAGLTGFALASTLAENSLLACAWVALRDRQASASKGAS
jgi:hypothetical protein